MIDHAPFSGVLAPVLTPFREDLSIDGDRYLAFCKQLLADGCNGLAVFGTTSEANSLSLAEKRGQLDALLDAGVDPACLMPGTGAPSLPETLEMTQAAVAAGCGGVLLLPPYYYKGVSDEGLFSFTSNLIERVGDARLKVYLYHIPPIAVVGWSLPLIERLIKAYPDTVVGLKDSSGDWNNTRSILEAFPGFSVFSGSEAYLLDTLRLGGAGTISASANSNATAIRRVVDNWQGESADALQAGITAYRKTLQQYPLIPALKALMAEQSGEESWRITRPPLMPMERAKGQELLAALAS